MFEFLFIFAIWLVGMPIAWGWFRANKYFYNGRDYYDKKETFNEEATIVFSALWPLTVPVNLFVFNVVVHIRDWGFKTGEYIAENGLLKIWDKDILPNLKNLHAAATQKHKVSLS